MLITHQTKLRGLSGYINTIMSFISKLFTSNTKDLVGEVGNVVDDLTTTEEENLEAKRKIKEIIETNVRLAKKKQRQQDLNRI